MQGSFYCKQQYKDNKYFIEDILLYNQIGKEFFRLFIAMVAYTLD